MNGKNGGFRTFLGGFLIGGFMGATIAFLASPRSGKDTSAQIQAKGIELRDTAEQTVDDSLAKVETVALDVSSRAEEIQAQS